jgi:rifampin ADP-ribosylating transferase
MVPAAAERPLHLATGLTTTITEAGAGDGVAPVLLLHGWIGSRRSFAALLPLLARRRRVIAADLRGHGDADKPPTGYDLTSLAADVVAVLDALQIPRAVLVGASSGGYVAQQVAVASPERVAGLVLAGAPHDLRGQPPFGDDLDGIADPLDPARVRAFVGGFTDLDRLPSWYVDLMVDDALRVPAPIWLASLSGLTGSLPPTDQGRIEAPTLVISGGRDGLLGQGQTDALLGAIPAAEWIDYPDTGHLVLEEQPDHLAADVLAFLAGLSGQDHA